MPLSAPNLYSFAPNTTVGKLLHWELDQGSTYFRHMLLLHKGNSLLHHGVEVAHRAQDRRQIWPPDRPAPLSLLSTPPLFLAFTLFAMLLTHGNLEFKKESCE